MMYSWTAPLGTDMEEMRQWALENCHGGFRLEQAPIESLPGVYGVAMIIGRLTSGPTLYVNDENELVHAKLRFG